MRRAVLLLTAMAVALFLASGVAFAAITCGGGYYCQGNNNDNKIYGTSGPDEIYGRGGGDTIYGK